MDRPDGVKNRIISSLEKLSNKQKLIARFILDNGYFTSFSSASEVGAKVGTTAATVVRFSQALGYKGYPELQEALREEIPQLMTTATRMRRWMSSEHPPESTTAQVTNADIKNIEWTSSHVSKEKINASLNQILKAHRIFVIGAGVSSAPVVFLTHSLKVMGFNAIGNTGNGLQTAVEMAGIKSDDLLFAIDLWRYVKSTVNAAAEAKKTNTPIIAITDSVVSPLSQLADIAFEVKTEGVAHSLSITALMSLLNMIIAMLADRVPDQVYESIKKVNASYLDNDLLTYDVIHSEDL